MRIDASVSFPPGWTTAQLHRILVRNRFEGAIAHGEPFDDAPPWILGWIGLPGAADHPMLAALESDLQDAAEAVSRDLAAEVVAAPTELPAVARFAQAHPHARVIVSRTAGAAFGAVLNPQWLEGITILAAESNVYVKIDGFLQGPGPLGPAIHTVLDRFGPARCIYGSGWPKHTSPGTWKQALAGFTQSMGPRSIEFREQVLGGTAAAVYRRIPPVNLGEDR